MKTVFKNKDEATAEMNNQKHIIANKLCPIFKTNCKKTSCMSYDKGSISKIKKNIPFPGNIDNDEDEIESYLVNKPFCCNTLVTGIINHSEH